MILIADHFVYSLEVDSRYAVNAERIKLINLGEENLHEKILIGSHCGYDGVHLYHSRNV